MTAASDNVVHAYTEKCNIVCESLRSGELVLKPMRRCSACGALEEHKLKPSKYCFECGAIFDQKPPVATAKCKDCKNFDIDWCWRISSETEAEKLACQLIERKDDK